MEPAFLASSDEPPAASGTPYQTTATTDSFQFDHDHRDYYSTTDQHAPINAKGNITGDDGLQYTPELVALHRYLWSLTDDQVTELVKQKSEFFEDEWKVVIRRLFVCVPGMKGYPNDISGCLVKSECLDPTPSEQLLTLQSTSPGNSVMTNQNSLIHWNTTLKTTVASESTHESSTPTFSPTIEPVTPLPQATPPPGPESVSMGATTYHLRSQNKSFTHISLSLAESMFVPISRPKSVRCEWNNECGYIFPYALPSDIEHHYTQKHPEALVTTGEVRCRWPNCKSNAKRLMEHIRKQHVDVWVKCLRCEVVLKRRDANAHLEVIKEENGHTACNWKRQQDIASAYYYTA
ncbi:hypothetical protein VNI00_015061 [Paramarasmius palmivorus]|uniref:C2H2-type domain-containing protein n=1 Tax=Paramarasmius palmivorus TaxID=297713 RepID=A0AAW0BMS2_9AGAR